MTAPIDVVVLGAGNRGRLAYGSYILRNPQDFRVVAVADPVSENRELMADTHRVPAEDRYSSWQELVARPRLARAAINATMDADHLASTMGLLDAGYDILLEKPVAQSPADCVRLVEAAQAADRLVMVCHVARYAPFFQAVAGVVRSGRLGKLASIDWRENLSPWFIAHNYVRGKWANAEQTTPMIVAKCCHDFDQLVWILDSPVESLSSFGASRLFRKERAGSDIPNRCTDGCPVEDACPYFAPRAYVQHLAKVSVLADLRMGPDDDLLEVLRTSTYGRCVYRCESTAVDHQVVAMQLRDGLGVTFTMHGGSNVDGRTMRFDGERATLLANQSRNEVCVHDHLSGEVEVIQPPTREGGHGGGDFGMMRAFHQALNGEDHGPATVAGALDGHLLAFAAEESRTTGLVIRMSEYRARYSTVGAAS